MSAFSTISVSATDQMFTTQGDSLTIDSQLPVVQSNLTASSAFTETPLTGSGTSTAAPSTQTISHLTSPVISSTASTDTASNSETSTDSATMVTASSTNASFQAASISSRYVLAVAFLVAVGVNLLQ